MADNTKKTSPEVISLAAEILSNPNSSGIQKSLAGSALAQANAGKQTGAEMEDKAAKVLNSDKYSKETKTLAGSVLAQSKKER